MRKSLLFAAFFMVALTIASAIPQSETSASQPPIQAPGKIGASAVWHPPRDFITRARAACDQGNPPNYAECFMAQMSEGGAATDAVNFTRMLFHESAGQVGIMSEFHKVGPLDVARVMYPLRANDNYGLLLVNGDPKVLDVDDLKRLDRVSMEQNQMYQSVKTKYRSSLCPTGGSSLSWVIRSSTDATPARMSGWLSSRGISILAGSFSAPSTFPNRHPRS